MPRIHITEFDTISLPAERARDKLPIEQRVFDHPAWPLRELRFYFDYNDAADCWIWRCELQPDAEDVDGPDADPLTIVPRGPALYGVPRRYRAWIGFTFLDLSRAVTRVTPGTLGAEVSLVAIPLPSSPGYAEWVERQRTADEGATTVVV